MLRESSQEISDRVAEIASAIAEEGLRYVSDATPGYCRKRTGTSFTYYDKDGKLAMTHYCMLGNRPSMVFKSSDAKTISFDFDKSCGINPKKESHMHALAITFEDADTITSSCQAIIDGKEAPKNPTTLKRLK